MALAKRKARPEPLFVAAKQLTPSAGQLLPAKELGAPARSVVRAAPVSLQTSAHVNATRKRLRHKELRSLSRLVAPACVSLRGVWVGARATRRNERAARPRAGARTWAGAPPA